MCAGICNYCGRRANKHEQSHGWALVHVGVTQLRMHQHCADSYAAEGLLPNSRHSPNNDSLRERVNRALSTSAQSPRRRYPEGKLWFCAPAPGVPLNFN